MKNSINRRKMITTVSTSLTEVIKNIMRLYNIESFDLDCNYNYSSWNKICKPKNKCNINPISNEVDLAYIDKLPYENDTMNSIFFYPPFIINNSDGNTENIKKYAGYNNIDEMLNHYYNTLLEGYRVLKNGGIFVFRCHDIVLNGTQLFNHCTIYNYAKEVGYKINDIFILILNNKNNHNIKHKNQVFAKKTHCYFWVFEK